MILDIGPKSGPISWPALQACKTLVWNGPLGAFETRPFDRGTVAVAQAAAKLTQRQIAAPRWRAAAIRRRRLPRPVVDDFSLCLDCRRAFLEWLEGKELPGVSALRGG